MAGRVKKPDYSLSCDSGENASTTMTKEEEARAFDGIVHEVNVLIYRVIYILHHLAKYD